MKVTFPDWQVGILIVGFPLYILILSIVGRYSYGEGYSEGHITAVIYCIDHPENCKIIYNYLKLKNDSTTK